MEIIPLHKDHFSTVAKIYQEGLETGIATFETQVPNWETWDAKFLTHCRFVAIENNIPLAWCALSPISKREVYKGVAEVTIYVSKAQRGKGLGAILLKHLISESEKNGYWTLQASIFPENTPSIQLHKKNGFRLVGYRKKIAQRHGIWYDNVLLERRSEKF